MDLARSVSEWEPIQATSRKPAQHDEGGNLRFIGLGQGDHPAVAGLPAFDEARHLRLMLVEGNRRCRVIHVPAEAAVIEIDDLHLPGRRSADWPGAGRNG